EEIAAGGDGSKATAFYLENRAIADEGAVAAWPERFNEDEASAIQNAMNLYYLNRAKFFSEYQNDPQAKTQTKELSPGEIRSRVNGLARGVVPLEATTLRSEEHTSELQSRENLVCRLLLEKKKSTQSSLYWT